MRNINPTATQQYIEKAGHFLKGMQLLAEDITAHRTGIGLLAIHSAISLSDAISVGLTGKRGKYQDHARAAQELSQLCTSNNVSNTQGVNHLAWLLSQKNAVAYDASRFDDDSIRQAVNKADRFNAWAYNYFKEILRAP